MLQCCYKVDTMLKHSCYGLFIELLHVVTFPISLGHDELQLHQLQWQWRLFPSQESFDFKLCTKLHTITTIWKWSFLDIEKEPLDIYCHHDSLFWSDWTSLHMFSFYLLWRQSSKIPTNPLNSKTNIQGQMLLLYF